MTTKPESRENTLPALGWREWVHLEGWEDRPIKAKVDTGARSSALHAEEIEPFHRHGEPWLRFTVYPEQKAREAPLRVEAPLVDRRSVRSSSGSAQLRPVVLIEVRLGAHRFPVEVSLTRRDRMGFRMLLGRTAIRGRFVVNPARSFLQGTRRSHTHSPPET